MRLRLTRYSAEQRLKRKAWHAFSRFFAKVLDGGITRVEEICHGISFSYSALLIIPGWALPWIRKEKDPLSVQFSER